MRTIKRNQVKKQLRKTAWKTIKKIWFDCYEIFNPKSTSVEEMISEIEDTIGRDIWRYTEYRTPYNSLKDYSTDELCDINRELQTIYLQLKQNQLVGKSVSN